MQEAFGLSDDEFAVLLGDGSDERLTQLAELSLTLVGHIDRNKRAAFLRSEIPLPGFPPGYSGQIPRRVPLEVAAEPDGFEKVMSMVEEEAARLIAKKRAKGANAPVPEAKKQ